MSVTTELNMPMFSYEPKDTASIRWMRWSNRFDNYLVASGIDKPERQKAMLLHMIGEELYDIFFTLKEPTAEAGETVYDVAKKALNSFFSPKRNVEFELFNFRQAQQLPNEDLDTYYARLKQLSLNCEFSNPEKEIKSQIIQKTSCSKLRDEGLCNPSRSLADLLKYGRTQEATKRQCKLMEEQMVTKPSAVQKVNYKNKPQQSKQNHQKSRTENVKRKSNTCYNCGGEWPHKSSKCPAYGKSCSFCHGKNHFESMCKAKNKKPYHKSKKHHVGHIKSEFDTDTSSDFEENEYSCPMYRIKDDSVNNCENDDPYIVSLQINGKNLELEIDTGSKCTIIDEKTYKTISDNTTLLKSRKKLTTYLGEQIPVAGTANVSVLHNGTQNNLQLVVVKSDGPNLVGRNWIRLLNIDWSAVLKVSAKMKSIDKNEMFLESIYTEFSSLFQEDMGSFNGPKVKLYYDVNAQPKFYKARPVPYAYKPLVEKELDRLVSEGVLEPVQFSEWATPIVPIMKPNGTVRICGNYALTVNQVSPCDAYPLPDISELYNKLSSGVVFSKLDLSHAYQQLLLDDESKKITTINTTKGLFQYTRLPFGVNSSPGIFQRTMDNLLQKVPGTAIYLDDIVITGKTVDEHDNNLRQVLSKLKDSGMRLKKSKCSFRQPSVEYLGHRVDSEGIHPTGKKYQAVQNAVAPKNISELRSFLGIVNYYHKFLHNLSSVLAPLYELLHDNVKWTWGISQRTAFEKCKEMLKSSKVLVHLIILSCDASPIGIACIMSHQMPDGMERPIMYASRTLSSSEKNYSQIERETLSIVYGVKHFHKFVAGRRFTIITDHKPLLGLLNPTKPISHMSSVRMQKWCLALGGYNFSIVHKPGKLHGNVDALSRLPDPVQIKNVPIPEEIVLVMNYIDSGPVTWKQISQASRNDSIISKVINFVQSYWPQNVTDPELLPYFNRRKELSIDQNCLLWGARVVVPTKLQKLVLQELHDCHPGVVKMKALSRSYVWWPRINEQIELTVKQCDSCQIHGNHPPSSPLQPWEWSETPWKRLHVDFAGPFENKMIFVIIDSCSKFIEAFVMTSTTTEIMISKLRQTFSTHGLPEIIVSDNGPQFISQVFTDFCYKNGIKHIKVSPYRPASNGLAERAVQVIKSGLKKNRDKQDSLETRLYRYLLYYNMVPQATTGIAPSEILMKRKLRSRLDLLRPNLSAHVLDKQSEMKENYDAKTKTRSFYEGDPVFIRNFLGGGVKWLPGIVERLLGPYTFLVKLEDGRLMRRHIDHVKLRYPSEHSQEEDYTLPSDSVTESLTSGAENLPDCVPENLPDDIPEDKNTMKSPAKISMPTSPPKTVMPSARSSTVDIPQLRRSSRNIRAPDKLNL